MADAKTDIVTHGGRVVVMDGKIVMGPCDLSWVLLINRMSFLDFSRKITAEKVRGDFVYTRHTTPVYGNPYTSETRSHVTYLPLGGEFVDDGSKWVYSSTSAQTTLTREIVRLRPLGIDGFVLYRMDDETGKPQRLANLGGIKPKEGVYILDMAISVVTQQREDATNRDIHYGYTRESAGEFGEGVDVFLEFEIKKVGDGANMRLEVVRHEILSCTEAYARYNEYFAFMQEYYFVGESTLATVYSKGTFEMDVTVTVEKNGGR